MAGSGQASRAASSASSSRRVSVTGSSPPSNAPRSRAAASEMRVASITSAPAGSDRVAQAKLEAPPVIRGARAAPEGECPDLGELRLELHGQRALLELAPEP